MTTILFVHGTGGRADDYESTFTLIARKLAQYSSRTDLHLAPCLWGEQLGSQLHLQGASIPLYDSTRSLDGMTGGETPDADAERMLWSLLYQDPLYELRLLVLRAGVATDTPSRATISFNSMSPGETLDEVIQGFTISAELEEKLEEMGVARLFPEAYKAVISSTTYQDVLQTLQEDGIDECCTAIARALVAQTIAIAQQPQYAPPSPNLWDAELRDAIITLLIVAFGDTSRSLGGDIAKLVLANPLTFFLRRWRGKTSDTVYPAAGDILLYQARGEPIRQFIREQIEQAAAPVVVLAHSLGGVACVDLLIQQQAVRQQVDLLVTVGSQVPFFYELGALVNLTHNQNLPPDFPSWLNLYDLNDFLSYVGARVFPDQVQDVLVDNGQPFPQAHGAYWTNPAIWKTILPRLP